MNTACIASADLTSLEAQVRTMLRLTLVTGEMERAEGSLVIMALYMGNPHFRRGLHDLAWRHQDTLKLLLERGPAFCTRWGEDGIEIEKAFREGYDPRPLMERVLKEMFATELHILGVYEYSQALRSYCHDWGLVGRDLESEIRWQNLVAFKLFRQEGHPLWKAQTDEQASLLLTGKTDTIPVSASRLEVARRGGKATALGLSPRIGQGFRRPRPRRYKSLAWLYLRVAMGIMPREIADAIPPEPKITEREEIERFVSYMLNRDARLVGLKIPRGWPTGRRRGGPTGRMSER